MMISPKTPTLKEAVPGWLDGWEWDFRAARPLDYFEVGIVEAHQLKLATQLWMKTTNQRWEMKRVGNTSLIRATRRS
jgi:hypothetical protein